MTTLAPRLLASLKDHRLAEPGEIIIVAVSGGADSICLLHCLAGLEKRLGITLRAAHLNHQLRPESNRDEDYVKQICAQIGLGLTVERYYVKEYQAAHRLTLEEAAREVRYQFLGRTAAEIGAARVLVAHSADDDVETLLLHIIRGSGPTGLTGLKPRSLWRSTLTADSVELGRPLLDTSRAETVEYCRAHALRPLEDMSNYDPAFLRNRVRHELIPFLETFNPAIRDALRRLSRLTAADSALLDAEAEQRWQQMVNVSEDGLEFRQRDLNEVPPALRQRLLRRAVETLRGNLKDIEQRHVDEMLALLEKPAGKTLNLPGGLELRTGYGSISLSRGAEDIPYPPLTDVYPIKIPGETLLLGWTVSAHRRPPAAFSARDNFTAYLDADRVGKSLWLRARRRGDRFQPLGLHQVKKLGHFLIDARVPRSWRDRVPIITNEDGIVWVAGQRIDARYRVTPKTRRVLKLSLRQTDSS